MTADAMVGTLEKCLHAGMDDYLTKPLEVDRLQGILDRFLPDPAAESTGIPFVQIDTVDDTVRRRLQQVAGTDCAFLATLIGDFTANVRALSSELRTAAEHADHDGLAKTAHKLKSASDNLHLRGVALLAFAIETRAKAREQRDWVRDVSLLSTELDRITTAMQAELERVVRLSVA